MMPRRRFTWAALSGDFSAGHRDGVDELHEIDGFQSAAKKKGFSMPKSSAPTDSYKRGAHCWKIYNPPLPK